MRSLNKLVEILASCNLPLSVKQSRKIIDPNLFIKTIIIIYDVSQEEGLTQIAATDNLLFKNIYF